MNIPTVDQFLQQYNFTETLSGGNLRFALIEFTKLHLKAQEEVILNLVSMNINSGNVRYTSLEYPGKSGKETITVDERSIKGAYSLENIK